MSQVQHRRRHPRDRRVVHPRPRMLAWGIHRRPICRCAGRHAWSVVRAPVVVCAGAPRPGRGDATTREVGRSRRIMAGDGLHGYRSGLAQRARDAPQEISRATPPDTIRTSSRAPLREWSSGPGRAGRGYREGSLAQRCTGGSSPASRIS